MTRALSLLAVAALLAAGCGGKHTAATTTEPSTAPPTTTGGETTQPPPTKLELFFLAADGQLVAASRAVQHTETPGKAALHQLMNPVDGATTQVPDGLELKIEKGDAHVTGATLNNAALAQLVYTLTAFPTVQTVNGLGRASVEDFVPAILVEHPTAGESVTSPLRVTGTANTFEATFNYQLKDAAGTVIAHDFVTATSGSGTRGTFDFTVPFAVDSAQDGTLVVFELSAENGSVIHQRLVPLRLVP